jgi:single-strand DNA-binding protein
MLNKCILIGRLTRNPEMKSTNNGTVVGNFTIACDRKFNKDETDFIQVVVWKKLAENVNRFTKKGSLVAVDGRLQVRSYENQEGRTVWVTEVVADDVRFLDSKWNDSEQPATDNNKQRTEDIDPFQGVGQPIDIDALSDDLPF